MTGAPSEPTRSRLRLGLLMDSFRVPAWIHTLLARLAASDYASLALVVLTNPRDPPCDIGSDIGGGGSICRAYQKLDRAVFRPQPDAFKSADAGPILDASEVLDLRQGERDALPPEMVEQLARHDLDVLLCLGSLEPQGPVLGAARYGVWALRHGDPAAFGGEPAGLWEVLEGRETIESILYVFSAEARLDGTLDCTVSKTDHVSINRTRNQHFWKTLSLVSRNLRRLRDGGEAWLADRLRKNEPASSTQPGHQREGAARRSFVAGLSRLIARNLRVRWQQAVFREQWVLLYEFGDGVSCVPSRFHELRPPPDRFWADPHVVCQDDQYHVFFEEITYRSRKGHISVLSISADGKCSEPITVLERPYHLAYPFVFEWQDRWWMIPDSRASRSIDVYRCDRFPDKWAFHKTLMAEVEAVDTTLLEHGGRWWLFTNLVENKGASSYDELFLYHADNPLSDNWTEHCQSPIVSDARRARPAGQVFKDKGALFRPAQNCGPRYGYGIRIFEIQRLDEQEYREREQTVIEPGWDPRVVGVHTIARAGRLTMIDAAFRRPRWTLSP